MRVESRLGSLVAIALFFTGCSPARSGDASLTPVPSPTTIEGLKNPNVRISRFGEKGYLIRTARAPYATGDDPLNDLVDGVGFLEDQGCVLEPSVNPLEFSSGGEGYNPTARSVVVFAKDGSCYTPEASD